MLSRKNSVLTCIMVVFIVSCSPIKKNNTDSVKKGKELSFCENKKNYCKRIVDDLHNKKAFLQKNGKSEKDLTISEKNQLMVQQIGATNECKTAHFDTCLNSGVYVPYMDKPLFSDLSGKGTIVDGMKESIKSILPHFIK